MAYFQEQLLSLSQSPPQAQRLECETVSTERESVNKLVPTAPVGGLLLALTIGAWSLSQTGSPGPASGAANSLMSAAAHSIPHLLAAGIVDAGVHGPPHAPHSERRREERKPEHEIEDALLSAEMFLAAGDIPNALEAMHSAAELIAALPDEMAIEQIETFSAAARDVLLAVCESARSSQVALDSKMLELAIQLAEMAGASEFSELLAALQRGESVANAA